MSNQEKLTVVIMAHDKAIAVHPGAIHNEATLVVYTTHAPADSPMPYRVAFTEVAGNRFYLCDNESGKGFDLTADIRQAGAYAANKLPEYLGEEEIKLLPAQYFDYTGEETLPVGWEALTKAEPNKLRVNQQRITVGPFPAIAEEPDPDTLAIYPLLESTFLEPDDPRRDVCIKLLANADGSVDVWLPSIGITGQSHATIAQPDELEDTLFILKKNHNTADTGPHILIRRSLF